MVSILLQRRLKYVNYLWKHVTSILTIPSNQEVQKSAFSKIGARPWNTEIPRSLTELTKMSFKSRRPSPNVPGYFWIRNFFFPDSKIYPSKHPMVSRFTDLEKLRRPEVRRPHVFRFVADLFFSLSLSLESDLKEYPDSLSNVGCVDGSHIRRVIVADSKICGYVRRGPWTTKYAGHWRKCISADIRDNS